MAHKILFKRCWVFILLLLIALVLQIIFFSPVSPDVLELPQASSVSLVPPSNNRLQRVTKLGEGLLKDPEDVAVDENGDLYTAATRNGWIRRLHRSGSWENWQKLQSNALLGITTAKGGGLIVCDCGEVQGINPQLVALSAKVDGIFFFSVASTNFQLSNLYLDLLEAKPHWQLLKYNPSTEVTSIVLDGLYFANGVALSKEEDFLVVFETWRFRFLNYRLKGENKGQTKIFVNDLPAGPDNINLAPDGSFRIALIQAGAFLRE